MAASSGNPGIAIGNAFGSNIVNIALILGLTSIIRPVMVSSNILKRQLPLLLLVIALTYFCIQDLSLSRFDGGDSFFWLCLINDMDYFSKQTHNKKIPLQMMSKIMMNINTFQ